MMFYGHVQTFSLRGNACSDTSTPKSKSNKERSCLVDCSISCQCFCLFVTFFIFLYLYFCFVLMWPGFNSRSPRHMWVEFVVGSRPCPEGFSPGTPVFLPPQKPTFPKFENRGWKSHPVESTKILIFFSFKVFVTDVKVQEPQTFINSLKSTLLIF